MSNYNDDDKNDEIIFQDSIIGAEREWKKKKRKNEYKKKRNPNGCLCTFIDQYKTKRRTEE